MENNYILQLGSSLALWTRVDPTGRLVDWKEEQLLRPLIMVQIYPQMNPEDYILVDQLDLESILRISRRTRSVNIINISNI